MKALLTLLLSLAGTAATFGQITFQKEFARDGNVEIQTVIQTSDGGYALAASSYAESSQTKDLWLIRTDSHGDTLWTRTYKKAFSYWSADRILVQTEDGGFTLLATRSHNTGLLHISATGDSLWEKTICPGDGFSLSAASGNRYIVSVNIGLSTQVILLDSFGNILWNKQINTGFDPHIAPAFGWSVRELPGTGFILSGSIEDIYSQPNCWLVCLGPAGDSLWQKVFLEGWLGLGSFNSVDTSSGGGFYVAGMRYGNGWDGFVMKFTPSGDSLWSSSLIVPRHQTFQSACATHDGGIIAIGNTYDTTDRVLLAKFSGSGLAEWNRSFLYGKAVFGLSVAQTTDNGYILAGSYSVSGTSPYRGFLIKTTSDGTIYGISDPPRAPAFSLFPNPARDVVTLKRASGSFVDPGKLELLDIFGHSVMRFSLLSGETERTFDVSSIREGMYMARIASDNGVIVTQKLVIRRNP